MKTDDKIKIGIIGYGVIGKALVNWLECNNPNCQILKIDTAKGFNEDISSSDVIFINIHVPTINGIQDLTNLKTIIKSCPDVPIFIRSTLLPGTCDKLCEEFDKDINFMPEFLTERNAQECFDNQTLIFTNHTQLLKQIFTGKPFIEMNSLEAEIAKYSHNVFGALKVTYFNGINELCRKLNANYENVRKGSLLSGYINANHTLVPGPDGKFGYDGKCFPKDVDAFINYTNGLNLHDLIENLPPINKKYRQ